MGRYLWNLGICDGCGLCKTAIQVAAKHFQSSEVRLKIMSVQTGVKVPREFWIGPAEFLLKSQKLTDSFKHQFDNQVKTAIGQCRKFNLLVYKE